MDRELQNLKADNDYLQQQVDQYREAEEQRRAAFDNQERARKQAARDSLTHASDWDEAFRNNNIRFGQEAHEEAALIAKYPDEFKPWFTEQKEINSAARDIYREERIKAQEEIAAINKRILQRTAERVAEQYPNAMVLEFLENDDPAGYCYW